MLSTWISSLNLLSVLSAQPDEREENKSLIFTYGDRQLEARLTGQMTLTQQPLHFFLKIYLEFEPLNICKKNICTSIKCADLKGLLHKGHQ